MAAHSFLDANNRFPHGIDGNHSWIVEILPFIEMGNYESNGTPITGVQTLNVNVGVCPSDPRGDSIRSQNVGQTALTWYVAMHTHDDPYWDSGIIISNCRLSKPELSITPEMVTDGLSTTVMFCERPPSPAREIGMWENDNASTVMRSSSTNAQICWPVPNDCLQYSTETTGAPCPTPAQFGPGNVATRCSTNAPWSSHTGGMNVALGDGSVRFLTYAAGNSLLQGSTTLSILDAMGTRSGGEVVILD